MMISDVSTNTKNKTKVFTSKVPTFHLSINKITRKTEYVLK